jgi:sec-independent protein translocase protein TatB
MFDISFSELVVIGMVALIVVGPERLPRVARTVGHLFGRAQRYARDIKFDIERQIEMDEIKEIKQTQLEASRAVRSIEQGLAREMAEAKRAVNAVKDTAASNLSTPAAAAAQPEAAVTTPDSATGTHAEETSASVTRPPA